MRTLKTISGAHIFSVGEHPGTNAKGLVFSADDLDNLIAAFQSLGQSTRVPLKLGHSDTKSGDPAMGWVSKIWRQGTKLLANFVDIPTEIYDSIRSGAFKFASIELLKGAKRGTEFFPFLLDSVALLGATPPAVADIGDLQRLTHERVLPAGTFTERLAFSASFAAPGDTADDAAAEAAATIADLQAKLAAADGKAATFARQQEDAGFKAEVEAAVRAYRITPGQRDAINDMRATPEGRVLFSRSGLRAFYTDTPMHHLARSTAKQPSSDGDRTGPEELVPNMLARIAQFQRDGGKGDVFSAWTAVVASDATARREQQRMNDRDFVVRA